MKIVISILSSFVLTISTSIVIGFAACSKGPDDPIATVDSAQSIKVTVNIASELNDVSGQSLGMCITEN